MTETLTDRIIRHEGFTRLPRPDNQFNGNSYVIGYGHDITEAQAIGEYASGITESEAMGLLESDIHKAQAEVNNDLPWTSSLSRIRQEVLCEMVFQLGMAGLLGFKNLLFHARSGDADGVARDMLDSKWHEETPGRCEELASLWLNG